MTEKELDAFLDRIWHWCWPFIVAFIIAANLRQWIWGY